MSSVRIDPMLLEEILKCAVPNILRPRANPARPRLPAQVSELLEQISHQMTLLSLTYLGR